MNLEYHDGVNGCDPIDVRKILEFCSFQFFFFYIFLLIRVKLSVFLGFFNHSATVILFFFFGLS